MNKQNKIGLIAGVIGFMFLMVWLFSGESGSSDGPTRKPYVSSNWSKKFQLYDKHPLGLYLFTSLANVHLDNKHDLVEINDWVQFDTLVNDNPEKKTFMFVGNNFGLKYKEIDTVLSQVSEGSDLFLSFNNLTDNLADRLLDGIDFRFDYTEEINVFARNKKYKMINLFQNDTIACEWRGISDVEEGINYQTLSSFMELSNFVRIQVGKGSVYLHTTPTSFYNYQLKRLHGFKYSEFVLNQLRKDRDIYLLEFGRLSDNYGNYDVDSEEGPNGKQDDSYLKLIFENPTLLTALLLSILGVILFVVFRSKRTRPVVPFVPEKKDMTMAFAETITSIYFAKRNPYGLLQVQRKNFYSTIHKHFFVDISRREDNRSLEILAEKSDRKLDEIKSLVARLETKEAFSVTDEYVSNTLKAIHKFYRSTGIISADLSEKVKTRELSFRRSLWFTFGYIKFGVDFTFAGIYLLMVSTGIGIGLIPIGMILFAMGTTRLSNPYFIMNGRDITYFTQFGRKRIYSGEDLLQIETRGNGVVFHYRDNKKLSINYRNISSRDRKQFQALITNLNKLEL